MNKTKLSAYAISASVGLVVLGVALSVGTLKADKARDVIDTHITKASAMGLTVSYDEVGASLMSDDITVSNITITGPALDLATQGLPLGYTTQKITIDQATFNQNISIPYLSNPDENGDGNYVGHIKLGGIDLGVDWNEIADAPEGSVVADVIKVILDAEDHIKLGLDVGYSGDLADSFTTSLALSLNDAMSYYTTAILDHPQSIMIDMMAGTQSATVDHMTIGYEGDEELTKNVIKVLAGFEIDAPYSDFLVEHSEDQAQALIGAPDYVKDVLYPEYVKFITNPRGFSLKYLPKDAVPLVNIMKDGQGVDEEDLVFTAK